MLKVLKSVYDGFVKIFTLHADIEDKEKNWSHLLLPKIWRRVTCHGAVQFLVGCRHAHILTYMLNMHSTCTLHLNKKKDSLVGSFG